MPRKLTTEEFIEKALKKHNGKYLYTKTIYKRSKDKVIIICPSHGDFLQIPNSHLTGYECPSCGYEKVSIKGRKSTDDFVKKSRKIHGDIYNYESVIYGLAHDKVDIICSTHGNFLQAANDHLRGVGCPSCAIDKLRDTQETFIIKANKVHNEKYKYNEVEYTSSRTPVDIECPLHGGYLQTPHSHLCGYGCPECGNINKVGSINRTTLKRNKDLRELPAILYHLVLSNKETGEVFDKVGLTTQKSVSRRSSNMSPYKTIFSEILFEGTLEDVYDLEQLILSEIKQSDMRYIPKLRFDGYTECYKRYS